MRNSIIGATQRKFVSRSLAALSMAGLASSAHATTGSHYGVTISNQETTNMVFSNGIYSATADGAILNVNDLQNALAAGNVEVTTGNGSSGDKTGDLHVVAGFTWASAFALTLDAYHSIFVAMPIVDAGSGALALTNNDGGTSGTIAYGTAGNVTIWGLTNTLTINGQSFTLIGNITTLASDIAANPSGAYALANSYDARKDGTYGSAPIQTAFTGVLDGLGNAIENLTIVEGLKKDSPGIGLFAQVSGSVRNVGLTAVDITNKGSDQSESGALAANNFGTISQSWSTGAIRGGGGLGGLVGYNDNYGTVTASWSSVAVYSIRALDAGGLVGTTFGPIDRSYATGDVVIKVLRLGMGNDAGGLAGSSVGVTISNSHATGKVKGGSYTGGLIGFVNEGAIVNCYATGRVQGTLGSASYAGGLLGTIDDNDNGTSVVKQSFATGAVSGNDAGGLVGDNAFAEVVNSYAEGKVDGSQISGGFVGTDSVLGGAYSTVGTSYSIGLVTGGGTGLVGGFMGENLNPSGYTTNSYWDTTTSKTNTGVALGNSSGVTGLTTAQFQSAPPSGFDPKIWAEDKKINHGLPYLINNPPQ